MSRSRNRLSERLSFKRGRLLLDRTGQGQSPHQATATDRKALRATRRCQDKGVDPASYSAHSLRAGCATEAASRGVEERDIGRHTRYRSVVVLRGCIRAGTVFENNASARLGL